MIAYLRRELGTRLIRDLLLDEAHVCFAHAINLCEVFYDFHRSHGPAFAINVIDDLKLAGVIPSDGMSTRLWQTAATLKAVYKRVSLADCFCSALAIELEATVLTADHHEFDQLVDQAVCRVQFIR